MGRARGEARSDAPRIGRVARLGPARGRRRDRGALRRRGRRTLNAEPDGSRAEDFYSLYQKYVIANYEWSETKHHRAQTPVIASACEAPRRFLPDLIRGSRRRIPPPRRSRRVGTAKHPTADLVLRSGAAGDASRRTLQWTRRRNLERSPRQARGRLFETPAAQAPRGTRAVFRRPCWASRRVAIGAARH